MSTLNWKIQQFADLSTDDLFSIFEIRQAVFIVEQACVYPDIDDLDKKSWHISAWDANGLVAAYARLMAPGDRYQQASIGRVLIPQNRRGEGLAKELMQHAIGFIENTFPEVAIKIGAQTYLEAFYKEFGFSTISEAYDEDGIMHIDMLRASSQKI